MAPLPQIFQIPNRRRTRLDPHRRAWSHRPRPIMKDSVPGVYVVPAGPDAPDPCGCSASKDDAENPRSSPRQTSITWSSTPAPVLPVSDTLVFGIPGPTMSFLCVPAAWARGITSFGRRPSRCLRSDDTIVGVLIKTPLEPEGLVLLRYGLTAAGTGRKDSSPREEEKAAPAREFAADGFRRRRVINFKLPPPPLECQDAGPGERRDRARSPLRPGEDLRRGPSQ